MCRQRSCGKGGGSARNETSVAQIITSANKIPKGMTRTVLVRTRAEAYDRYVNFGERHFVLVNFVRQLDTNPSMLQLMIHALVLTF